MTGKMEKVGRLSRWHLLELAGARNEIGARQPAPHLLVPLTRVQRLAWLGLCDVLANLGLLNADLTAKTGE
ncbi:hypothetical protein TIFTF001_011320 [Ficus carica]|uniref:Uncharacterized protein n=1 Tax=Ficus carica TaxID=3494 RepID=A0AA88A063_FICCA|nr:hypothetical protein TIFTF001_011320 [Ficus carica]